MALSHLWPSYVVALLVCGMAFWRINAPIERPATPDIGPYIAILLTSGVAIGVIARQERRIAALELSLRKSEE